MTEDPCTYLLPRHIKRSGHYMLRKVDGTLKIYLDYKDGEGVQRSMLVQDDGIYHVEDFATHVDNLQEEARCMMADARKEFGF